MTTPVSRRGITILEFFKEPANRKAYADWLRDPMTQRVLDLTETSIRPVMKPVDMTHARYGGFIDGRYETMRVLTHLDTIYEAIQSAQEVADVPETYGVEETLPNWGIRKQTSEAVIKKEE